MTAEDRPTAAEDGAAQEALTKLNQNLVKMDELTKRLVQALSQRRSADHGLQGPGPELYAKAMAAYWSELANNPGKLIEKQVGYWGQALKHAVEAQHALASGKPVAPKDEQPKDRRFSDPLWTEHPYYNFLKQQYQISAQAIADTVQDLGGLDRNDKRRVEFFSQQILDLFAPTNFLATNPEAMTRAVETEGESLVRGLENLVRDIEANRGDWLVTLSDPDAFELGGNIATTEGSVVYRNRMFELIQYAPTTEKVQSTPIVLFPPWINKFYILDLKPQNSLIKWIVEQGYTLFVVSWVNPDESYSDVDLATYVEEGYLEAIAQAKAICNVKQVNAIGYCIAGTTLALTLALMKRRGDKSVKSATFFTTLADFEDPGEMGVFLDDDFVHGIERESAAKGYLDKFFMGRTFSYLRSRDLVYGPAIKSYMLGEAPPAFDLLYWNGDGTNLPGPMVTEYLRELCMGNKLAQGGFDLLDEKGLTLADVEVPLCAVACETDHIAHWKGAWQSVKKMGAKDRTFILSESGHIAGIVNPPSKGKYGHYTNDGNMGFDTPEAWHEAASFTPGSWWPRWEAWIKPRSGRQVNARAPGGPDHPVLCPAPGTYVLPKRPIAAE
ncbi:PHA/PHB synthase family protein [Jannaschia seohaensis]|uniref:Polyhydroxyalkanoate synthase n=1 Tax=Jannaschia seohaensis TaxID=475081 RepID=A0A2Y9C0S9_9RHOB|nr:class I poly(R)-hydroxyalkanoic acid synthase [Jannaschia seohaensis]PWJ18277.1 polyhydroxyalkanoate synthase [Jannaschia seohaensis]SSA46802.1 polyhydroxyalkanoate synthase [Jannaschia seohaensis]